MLEDNGFRKGIKEILCGFADTAIKSFAFWGIPFSALWIREKKEDDTKEIDKQCTTHRYMRTHKPSGKKDQTPGL